MRHIKAIITIFVAGFFVLLSDAVQADPCGMVPPVTVESEDAIKRKGAQKTYVFHRNNIESFVVRPGFEGKVEDFGMLIPFPSTPSLRKVPNNVFDHIAAAVDPPEVTARIRRRRVVQKRESKDRAMRKQAVGSQELEFDEVNVVSEEAVGMYQTVVLEAGSATALKNWMNDHEYRYPNGMDEACNDYIRQGWCFVAVKARVGNKAGVNPKPGMKDADPEKPDDATYDGSVQAMGFRFRTAEPVVPMRLSAYNKGKLHNIVYMLTDGPRSIKQVPEKHVKRQVSGEKLYKNVTNPLPLRLIGGTMDDVPKRIRSRFIERMKQRRNPEPVNGRALDLFVSDLLAARKDRLAHPFEEKKKDLLSIEEHLDLRGEDVDKLNREALADARREAREQALDMLKGMTMTVVDGEFRRKVLKRENLTFVNYQMPSEQNRPEQYNAQEKGPEEKDGEKKKGTVIRKPLKKQGFSGNVSNAHSLLRYISVAAVVLLLLLFFGIRFILPSDARTSSGPGLFVLLLAGAYVLLPVQGVAQDSGEPDRIRMSYLVVESGNHHLQDGRRMVADRFQLDEKRKNGNHRSTYEQFSGDAFSEVPVVLTQIQTMNDRDPVVVRVTSTQKHRFSAILQEEEASEEPHGEESVGYVALGTGVGQMESGLFEADRTPSRRVNHSEYKWSFHGRYSEAPLLFTSLQSGNGGNPVSLHHRNLQPGSVRFTLREETSKDQETSHTGEQAGYLVMESSGAIRKRGGTPIGETGTVTVDPSDGFRTHSISLRRSYESPVVLMSSVPRQKKTLPLVRVSNVSSGKFQFRFDTWKAEKGLRHVMNRMRVTGMGEAGLKEILSYGTKAIPYLVHEAREGSDLTGRGWAIVALSKLAMRLENNGNKTTDDNDGASTWKSTVDWHLRQLHNNSDEPKLVRTWAAAARIRMTSSPDELKEFFSLINRSSELIRPLKKQIARFDAADMTVDLVKKLIKKAVRRGRRFPGGRRRGVRRGASSSSGNDFASMIMKIGPEPLVEVMTSADQNWVRRMAASYLGGIAQKSSGKRKNVVQVLEDKLAYKQGMDEVPWKGGALFLPGINWKKEDARRIVKQLMTWYLWCNDRGKKAARNQINRNFRNRQFSRAAGVNLPGNSNSAVALIRAWGEATDRGEVQDILQTLNYEDKGKYRKVLRELQK